MEPPRLEPPRAGPAPKAAPRPALSLLETAPRGHRLAPGPAHLAAAALLALAIGLGSHGMREATRWTAAPPAPAPPVAAASPAPATPAPSVGVQVNARPWAQIRVDGRDIGPTPLRVPLPPGAYEFEAALPDGQTLRRRVEIDPAQRFVAFP